MESVPAVVNRTCAPRLTGKIVARYVASARTSIEKPQISLKTLNAASGDHSILSTSASAPGAIGVECAA